MINIGITSVSGIYLGNTPIVKIYQGSNIIYTSGNA